MEEPIIGKPWAINVDHCEFSSTIENVEVSIKIKLIKDGQWYYALNRDANNKVYGLGLSPFSALEDLLNNVSIEI